MIQIGSLYQDQLKGIRSIMIWQYEKDRRSAMNLLYILGLLGVSREWGRQDYLHEHAFDSWHYVIGSFNSVQTQYIASEGPPLGDGSEGAGE